MNISIDTVIANHIVYIRSFIYGKINEIAFVYTQHAAASIYTKRDFNSLANLIYKSEERLCAVMILSG